MFEIFELYCLGLIIYLYPGYFFELAFQPYMTFIGNSWSLDKLMALYFCISLKEIKMELQ